MYYDFVKCFKVFLCSFLLVFLLGLNVHSASFEFVMGDGSSIDVEKTEEHLALYANVDEYVAGKRFTLEEGNTERFKFGTIGTTESSINSDDRESASVTASLDFESPELIEAVGGTSIGFAGFLKFNQGWEVTWENPEPIAFGNEGIFSIVLDNLSFSSDWWAGPEGEVDLFANITLNSAPAHAPEPSTMILFGLGLLGFGVFAGKRFRKN
jgi:hypothetical protein